MNDHSSAAIECCHSPNTLTIPRCLSPCHWSLAISKCLTRDLFNKVREPHFLTLDIAWSNPLGQEVAGHIVIRLGAATSIDPLPTASEGRQTEGPLYPVVRVFRYWHYLTDGGGMDGISKGRRSAAAVRARRGREGPENKQDSTTHSICE